MRSDCPSMPTRGSRLVGLLSMIMTSVERSSGCEQESSGNRKAASKSRSFRLGKLRVTMTNIALGSDARDLYTRDLYIRDLYIRDLCIRNLPQDCRALCSCG